MPFRLTIPPTPFPTYLLPSLPFRRRKSSEDSSSSLGSSSTGVESNDFSFGSGPDGGYLPGSRSHLRCARCLSDLALGCQIISKNFTGRHGQAYLVAPSQSAISPNPSALRSAKARNDLLPNLPNTFTHKPVPRQLVTGAHTVGDISCAQCGSVLGWKYIHAEEESQHYKVGKFILETKRVCRAPTWEADDLLSDEHATAVHRSALAHCRNRVASDALEFDSQDEDECEDLFMGVWTPQLAASRRRAKLTSPTAI